MSIENDDPARLALITSLVGLGCTYKEIGEDLGISRQRVAQIVKSNAPNLGPASKIKTAHNEDKYACVCHFCGVRFNRYPKLNNKFCSLVCRNSDNAKRFRRYEPENYWDAWFAWLRTGSLKKASSYAGTGAFMNASRFFSVMGIRLAKGTRIRHKRKRRTPK